jgi:DNA-binding XRE family transcriptional regulator
MAKGLNDFLDTLSPAERTRVEVRGAELIAEELTLRALRQAHDLTQERMAELLGVKQENVSRMERRTDLLLSTMASYVEAMGGRLQLVAEFPGQKPVVIKALGEIGSGDAGGLKAA